jgi:hypothetical protein
LFLGASISSINVLETARVDIILNEGFEGGIPSGWNNNGWLYGPDYEYPYGHAHTGIGWAYCWGNGDSLTTSALNFGDTSLLTFWYAAEQPSHPMSLEVYCDTDLVWSAYEFTHDYLQAVVDLSAYHGAHTIRFMGKTDDFYGQMLDDILISDSTSENNPPYSPSNPFPENQATDVAIDTDLRWTGGDPDAGDVVTYDVYLGTTLPLEKVANNLSTVSFDPGALTESMSYSWSIVAWDNHGLSTTGTIWTFTTIQSINAPPHKPDQPSGQASGKIKQEYTYTTSTTDPNGDQVQYLWFLSDGYYSGWLGPYNSGDTCTLTHAWSEEGSYQIKVKARDDHGYESDWSDPLEVSMPKIHTNYPLIQLLQRLLERFSFLQSPFFLWYTFFHNI